MTHDADHSPAASSPARTPQGIAADSFLRMWAELLPVGLHRPTGGYRRYAWTSADAECRAWFEAQADARGLRAETDRNGNQWAWWGDPDSCGPGEAVAVGSHLDSVPDGGAFDGPLGVVTGFAALDALRAEAEADAPSPPAPRRPLAVVNFADEEGARFGLACTGSRLSAGLLDPEAARALTDTSGTTLAQAMERAGHDPAALGPDPERWSRIGALLEPHVEQGRALEDLGSPIALGSVVWPHGRWRFDFHGEADHAGTTRLEDRRDPMLTYATTVLTARKRARLAGARATCWKVAVNPNAVNAIPSLVSGWLDARAADAAALRAMVEEIETAAMVRGARDGVEVRVVRESHTAGTAFDHDLGLRLAAALAEREGPGTPPLHALPTGAGHDAGVLSAVLPTAMLYIRNPTGISHAPAEHAREQDCLAGVAAVTTALRDLLAHGPASPPAPG